MVPLSVFPDPLSVRVSEWWGPIAYAAVEETVWRLHVSLHVAKIGKPGGRVWWSAWLKGGVTR